MEIRGIHASLAGQDPDHSGGIGAGRRDLDADPPGMEAMSGISLDDARALLAERNLLAVGAQGDAERRRRHGVKTTFVRVLDVHANAIPAGIPAGGSVGEFRVTGKTASSDDAVAA